MTTPEKVYDSNGNELHQGDIVVGWDKTADLNEECIYYKFEGFCPSGTFQYKMVDEGEVQSFRYCALIARSVMSKRVDKDQYLTAEGAVDDNGQPLKMFQKVWVRDHYDEPWRPNLFHYKKTGDSFLYKCQSGYWEYCKVMEE